MPKSGGIKIQAGGDRVLQQREHGYTGLEGSRRDSVVHQKGGVSESCA